MADTLFRRSNNDDLGPIEKDNPGTQPIRNLVALQSLLSPRSTKIISKKIFSNNESEFLKFIQHLESHQSWQESLKLIEGELRKRKIKENDQSAVLLTNIVYRRYFPHDDGVKID